MADDQRRLPAVERDIAGIQPEDIRIRVLGTVIDRSPEGTSIIVDDGTGKITVNGEGPFPVEVNQLVRVFGRVVPLEKGAELQGEFVQSMAALDLDLRKKVRALKGR
ncbi:MAG: replication protein RepA [Candidatus Aenigmarchaeota archaeon]|nr:replication protein RepA [Candidatus Aenigmarchaeota archaeon]